MFTAATHSVNIPSLIAIKEIMMDVVERFLQYVKELPNGCHEWQSTIKRDGYGQFWFNRPQRAHRVAYELFKEDIPEGKLVLHTCDNRKCVNPDHLYAGTHKDNVADMHDRKRFVGNATLTQKDVDEIRRAYSAKEMSQGQLAKKYGVNQPAISKIVLFKTWV